MWWVALSLGLFGSLHCVGMCGPLAIVFCNKKESSNTEHALAALSYNLGRTMTYTIIGLLMGILGNLLVFTHLQKTFSLIAGLVLVIAFLFTIDIEKVIHMSALGARYHHKVRSLVTTMIQHSREYHPFILGMANGLLPCGLVYLALAGALTTGSMWSSAGFMALFGLGTLPMLAILTTGIGSFSISLRSHLRKVLPFVSLAFGIYLIYRGVAIHTPRILDFWEALEDPIMCH